MRSRTARDPVVELRDGQGRPLAGAPVTFMTPEMGPSALFGGEHMLVTQTDASGRAYGLGLHPNAIAGEFEIRVTASYRSSVATAVIRQINAAPEEAKSSRKAVWIAAIAGGAAAAGIFAAMHGSSGSTPAQTVTSAPAPVVTASSTPVLTSGSSTFGPPQ